MGVGDSLAKARLAQAFQELSSEVTVTVLVSEEYSHESFPFWGLGGGGVREHGVTKDISLRGSAGFGGISTVATAPPVEPTVASKTIRTFGGKLSWPDNLLGPRGILGGATGISDFLGSLWAAGLADRASRRQQSKAGLFHICQLRPRCYEVCGPRLSLPLSLQSSDVHPISGSTGTDPGTPSEM